MKRTRKWAYVAQEAIRLADLGLAPGEIAKRLSVRRSTVQRWMQAGKLSDTRRLARAARVTITPVSAQEWGKSVRAAYALDATDEELVKMGEAALEAAHDDKEGMTVRLSAMGRFQAIVKQLALVTRNADEAPKPEAVTPRPARPARSGIDPRNLLMAVK